MDPHRFDRFFAAAILQQIGRERVTSLLTPFAPELLGHGIVLPGTALPDEAFFFVLATLPRQQERLSAKLLEAMTAIEVIEEVYPDEVPAASCPLVVSEIRLRLAGRSRPVLLTAEPRPGTEARSGNDGSSTVLFGNLKPETLTPEMGTARGDARPSVAAEVARPYHVEMVAREIVGSAGEKPAARGVKGKARYKFSRKGSVYTVRYAGLAKFHMPATDGAKYLDRLLHQPNEVFRAFDLERAVKPDKAGVRGANSVQKTMDGRALREVRSELLELEAELREAEAAGLVDKAEGLQQEIGQIKNCLVQSALLGGDSGERARNNVRKAIGRVLARLRKGSAAEQALALHLTETISLGYEIVYTQPAGKIWGDSVTSQ